MEGERTSAVPELHLGPQARVPAPFGGNAARCLFLKRKRALGRSLKRDICKVVLDSWRSGGFSGFDNCFVSVFCDRHMLLNRTYLDALASALQQKFDESSSDDRPNKFSRDADAIVEASKCNDTSTFFKFLNCTGISQT